ncbi:MAG: alpha/beta fold hydrolase [Candidatus Sericytochromatia bacterium]
MRICFLSSGLLTLCLLQGMTQPLWAADTPLSRDQPGMGLDGSLLAGFDYPFPVQQLQLEMPHGTETMAYMDVQPRRPNGKSVLLLHGKNFNGAYWEATARALTQAGYRVVIPDQIGFGKSSRPTEMPYSFQLLARHTAQLLAHLKLEKVTVTGHSMGGMLATRFALMYPAQTEKLVLINPIGLEDWKAKGVPYQPLEAAIASEKNQTPEKLQAYQQQNYYGGTWSPAYARWLAPLVLQLNSPALPQIAWNAALTAEMIFTQPVVYELPLLRVPTLLIIGQRDRTAIGRERAPAALRERLGNYPELGKAAARAIPNAQLAELDDVGHLPQIEAFPRFWQAYQAFLSQP